MEGNMDIAIKYEKLNLGDDKFVFKPVCVIQGLYYPEEQVFETEYGEECRPINSEDIFADSYFGNVVTQYQLLERYRAVPEEDVLMEFFDEAREYYTFGYFDYMLGQTQILRVSQSEVEKIVNQKLGNNSVNNTEEKTATKLDSSNIEPNISSTVFDVNVLKDLREIEDLEELKTALDELISFASTVNEELSKTKNDDTKSQRNTNKKTTKNMKLQKNESSGMTLKELRKEVKDVIKGQDKAVNDVTRAIMVNQLSSNPKHKSHMLIIGPSGTGKTEMINIISKKMGIPFFKADATAYTKEGYVGKSVYSMINGLITAADGSVEKAQHGILIIDEIDKKLSTSKDDVGGLDVLYSMLKMMDRDIIEVDQGHGFGERQILFDTSNLTIIFMGAFADLYRSKEKSQKKGIGFNTSSEEPKKEKINITNEDLINSGMPPEFLGRIPVVTSTEELELEDLVEILYKSKGGAIDEEKEFFKGLGITLKFTAPYMREIAKKAHQTKTGARNLRKLVRESLAEAYDEILSGKDVKELKLTKETAHDPKKYYTA